MTRKIVIVGNGPAGNSAAGAARLTDRTAEIIVVDAKKYDLFHPCAMPFVIGGYLPSIETIIEKVNYELMKVTMIRNAKAEEIDSKNKAVHIKNSSGEEKILEYDSLILCTGSKVFIPPVPGKELKNVFSLKWAEDAEEIKRAVEQNNIQKVIIVGGSAIGIEVSAELAHREKEVTIIEMQPQLMPFKLSKSFAELVKEELEKISVKIRLGTPIKEIIGEERVEKVRFGNEDVEETIAADLVVMATGVRPNIELIKKIGMDVGKLGGIKVNEKMGTSIEGIYAAGDCVEVNNPIISENELALLGGPAVRQGRVAGINAAGGSAVYPGSVNAAIVSSRTFFAGLTGINEVRAKELGIPVTVGRITTAVKPHYMPDTTDITLKLIAHTDDGKILGAEAVGEKKVDVNINYATMAIQAGLTVYDIMNVDFCYAPAVSETIYPIVKVADSIIRKIERKKIKASKD